MIRHDYTRRLTYINGGGVQVAAGPWPVSGVGTSPGTEIIKEYRHGNV